MRRFVRRCAAIAIVVSALAAPTVLADDPAIQPPFPHSIPAARHVTFWQVVRIVLLNV